MRELNEEQLKWMREKIKFFAKYEESVSACRSYLATQKLDLKIPDKEERHA